MRTEIVCGEMPEHLVRVGLHQVYAFSPYFFTLAMDTPTKDIQEIVPRCMSFVDDLLLISKTAKQIISYNFAKALESTRLKIRIKDRIYGVQV